MSSIYLDSAAVVKLVHVETETAALRAWILRHRGTPLVSSALLEIEAYRALTRVTAPVEMPTMVNDLHLVLDNIDRSEIDGTVRILAQTIAPPTVRSLDAIHLATALLLRDRVGIDHFVTYDKRLAEAAASRSLQVIAPA